METLEADPVLKRLAGTNIHPPTGEASNVGDVGDDGDDEDNVEDNDLQILFLND